MRIEPRQSAGRIPLLAAGLILLVTGVVVAILTAMFVVLLVMGLPHFIGLSDPIYISSRAYFVIVGVGLFLLSAGVAWSGYASLSMGEQARAYGFAGAMVCLIVGFVVGGALPTGPILSPVVGVVSLILVAASDALARSGPTWPARVARSLPALQTQPTTGRARTAVVAAGIVLLASGLLIAIFAGIVLVPALNIRYVNIDPGRAQAFGTLLRAMLIGVIVGGVLIAGLGYVATGGRGRAVPAAVFGGVLWLVGAFAMSGILPLGPLLPLAPGAIVLALAAASLWLSRSRTDAPDDIGSSLTG